MKTNYIVSNSKQNNQDKLKNFCRPIAENSLDFHESFYSKISWQIIREVSKLHNQALLLFVIQILHIRHPDHNNTSSIHLRFKSKSNFRRRFKLSKHDLNVVRKSLESISDIVTIKFNLDHSVEVHIKPREVPKEKYWCLLDKDIEWVFKNSDLNQTDKLLYLYIVGNGHNDLTKISFEYVSKFFNGICCDKTFRTAAKKLTNMGAIVYQKGVVWFKSAMVKSNSIFVRYAFKVTNAMWGKKCPYTNMESGQKMSDYKINTDKNIKSGLYDHISKAKDIIKARIMQDNKGISPSRLESYYKSFINFIELNGTLDKGEKVNHPELYLASKKYGKMVLDKIIEKHIYIKI